MHRNRNRHNHVLLNAQRKGWHRHSAPEIEVVHKGEPIILKDSNILTPGTQVKGQYENAGKELFLSMGLLVWYEATNLEIPRAENSRIWQPDIYPPDFVTNLFVGGKQVIIELHNPDHQYFQRMGRFRKTFGDRFYYILVDSCLEDASEASVQVGSKGDLVREVDEFWMMPKIKTYKRGIYDRTDTAVWKEKMGIELRKFLQERDDKCEDREAAMALVNVKRKG